MRKRGRERLPPSRETHRSTVDEALAVLKADELREIVRELMCWLDDADSARFSRKLIERAFRGGSGWAPLPPPPEIVAEVTAFVDKSKREGFAEPHDVDDFLSEGLNAFLAGDYSTTLEIFRILLPPIGEGEIYLGYNETPDEVLGISLADCAAAYVVAAYMTAPPADRAKTVREAIEEVSSVRNFWEPLREIERVAQGPLAGFDDFLHQWRAVAEQEAGTGDEDGRDTRADRWLREVVQRMDGAGGLARLARRTRLEQDLRAWCRALVEERRWENGLAAYEEAAGIVKEMDPSSRSLGELLDGAALCAQELSRDDLPAWLERAWKAAPKMARLRRYLGTSKTRDVLRKRAAKALDACPMEAVSQRALLFLVLGNREEAALLLAQAPGLGWSREEHPGHLLFPLFAGMLGNQTAPVAAEAPAARASSMENLEWEILGHNTPRLATPGISQILDRARVMDEAVTAEDRERMLAAMRTAAEERLAGITAGKHRRHYGHAASLAMACLEVDPIAETEAWFTEIRTRYRRFSALQRELIRLGAK